MNDTTDTRRPPMMGVPPIPFAPRRAPGLRTEAEEKALAAVEQAAQQPVTVPRFYTQTESIARRLKVLPYGKMKVLAAGVLGKDDQAEIIVLADRLHAWAEKAKVPQ